MIVEGRIFIPVSWVSCKLMRIHHQIKMPDIPRDPKCLPGILDILWICRLPNKKKGASTRSIWLCAVLYVLFFAWNSFTGWSQKLSDAPLCIRYWFEVCLAYFDLFLFYQTFNSPLKMWGGHPILLAWNKLKSIEMNLNLNKFYHP